MAERNPAPIETPYNSTRLVTSRHRFIARVCAQPNETRNAKKRSIQHQKKNDPLP